MFAHASKQEITDLRTAYEFVTNKNLEKGKEERKRGGKRRKRGTRGKRGIISGKTGKGEAGQSKVSLV